ncbi:MAG TPA: hypothetical protein VN258_15780 [Mobilitalea sp.]|nr:hypothetical protein [Mobilitalea sp.]
MRTKYIPASIMLFAGAVTSILNIFNKVPVVTGLQRLLLVLVIFYILGLIAKAIISKVTQPKPKTDGEGKEEEEEEGEKQDKKENSENPKK